MRVAGELLKDVKYVEDKEMVEQKENGQQTIIDELSQTWKE